MGVTEILSDLVSIPSVFPNEHEMGAYCRNKLEGLGFSVTQFELSGNRPVIVATRGENPSFAFFGHMDTVPVYGSWDTNPHELVEKEGKLCGLGAGDMKGGIAAFFSALEGNDAPAMAVLTSDEENNSAGSHFLSSRPELFEKIKLMVSAEPTEHGNEEGSILLGRRGRAVYEVNVKGVSSHAAHLDRGVNAIEKAAELIIALNNFPSQKNTEIGNQELFVRQVSGENTSLSLPEFASFQIDMHLVTDQTDESERSRLDSFLRGAYDGCTVSVFDRGLPYNMPFYTHPENPEVQMLRDIVEKVVGRVSWSHGESVADDNVMAQLCPLVSYGPVARNYHAANEYVDKQSLLNCEEVYSQLLSAIR
ncbi:MAG: M20 family metallopeptidase [Candidatus Micrarchaeia archaeon]